MFLHEAQNHAAKLCDWLRPFTDPATGHQIHVAGSIRRQRPHVNDIDLVCIPQINAAKDLTGAAVDLQIPLLAFLASYIRDRNPTGARTDTLPHFISGWDLKKSSSPTLSKVQPGSLPKQVLLWLPKIRCQIDLWLAGESTFATRFLCRTGSKEHNIWLAQRALDLGGHWNPYEGLTINRAKIPIPLGSTPRIGEECLYAALELKYIEPEHREGDWIKKNLEFGL